MTAGPRIAKVWIVVGCSALSLLLSVSAWQLNAAGHHLTPVSFGLLFRLAGILEVLAIHQARETAFGWAYTISVTGFFVSIALAAFLVWYTEFSAARRWSRLLAASVLSAVPSLLLPGLLLPVHVVAVVVFGSCVRLCGAVGWARARGLVLAYIFLLGLASWIGLALWPLVQEGQMP